MPSVEGDLKQMKARSRVTDALNTDEFKEAIEKIASDQGNKLTSLNALSKLLNANDNILSHKVAVKSAAFGGLTIADIDYLEESVGRPEIVARCKLACFYRMVHAQNWQQSVSNFISLLVKDDEKETFLHAPYGMLFSEATASAFILTDSHNNVLSEGSSDHRYNPDSAALSLAIYHARPDLRCVVHLQHPDVQAVTLLKSGLLPLTTDGCLLGDISVMDHSIDGDFKNAVAEALGVSNKVLLMRNRGALVCAERIEEAWFMTQALINACSAQIQALRAVAGNTDELCLISEDTVTKYKTVSKHYFKPPSEKELEQLHKDRRSRIKLIWEGQMRLLDSMGLKSGVEYSTPFRSEGRGPPSRYGIEVGAIPASYVSDSEGFSERTRSGNYIVSPNRYRRQEQEEGFAWALSDQSDYYAEPSSPHKFSGPATNSNELAEKTKQIKFAREHDKTTPGYTPKLLEGVTWKEAAEINADENSGMTVTSNKTAFNPFENVGKEDLQRYQTDIERKQRGLPTLQEEEEARRIKSESEAKAKTKKEVEAEATLERKKSKKSKKEKEVKEKKSKKK